MASERSAMLDILWLLLAEDMLDIVDTVESRLLLGSVALPLLGPSYFAGIDQEDDGASFCASANASARAMTDPKLA